MMDRLDKRPTTAQKLGKTILVRLLILAAAFVAIERGSESVALACWSSAGCSCNGTHTCNMGLSCISGTCSVAVCTPTTCAALGATCGTPDNGCGTALSCGSCTLPATCGGGAIANTCGSCTPAVACPGGKVCGSYSDGCGGSLNCGTCSAGLSCTSSNTCGSCVANTCASLGKNCNTVSDGCGGSLNCGSCGVAGQSCGGGGSPNVCGSGATAPLAFGAGSLIIPMDNCYNPDYSANPGPTNSGAACVAASTAYSCYAGSGYPTGNVRLPFGLLYLLAINNIPVNIILNPAKTSLADPDMSITPPSGSARQTASVLAYNSVTRTYAVNTAAMSCTTNTVYYPGMPFVVDAPYAAQALQVIANFSNPEFTTIPLQIANYPFYAPVLTTLASRPKPVLIDGAPLDTFFTESGIPDVVQNTYLTVTGSGSAYTYQWPTSVGTIPVSSPGCGNPSGGYQTCNALTYTDVSGTVTRIADVLWNHIGDINNWAGIGTFFKNGGIVFTLADATSFEGSYDPLEGGKLGGSLSAVSSSAQKGPFCAATPSGVASYYSSTGSTTDYPASDPFLQLGTMDIFIHGGGGGDGSAYKFASAPAAKTHALTNGAGDNAISGHPIVGGVQASGTLVYLASLNSWHGGAAGKDGGLRIMYNTLIADGDPCGGVGCVSSEFSRASPVAGLYGEYYRGTFEWPIPTNTFAGASLFNPPIGTYPYSTGHLREYKAAAANTGLGGNTSTPYASTNYSLRSTCSPTDTTSPCNWDSATLMKPYVARNVYVVSPSTTTLVSASAASGLSGWSATNTTIAVKLTRGAAGVLGGIDYGSAAVIEPKPTGLVAVAGAPTRPTIAYAGGRDGMLHAFCVAPGSADATGKCYGVYARGEEIWAVIPPGVQRAMVTANTTNDWSKINVGGTVRVADLQDTFTGETSAGYRTILIVGSRDLGFVDAFDISNPNPTNINTDGFRYLWENDGTSALTGTPPLMKQTMGASIALVDSTTLKGVALVSASASTVPGIVTYGMQVGTGKVFAYDSRAYTKTIPLPAGASGPVPNDVPGLPTITDLNNDGNDETVFVADYEGVVQKIGVTTSSFSSSSQIYAMSTTGNGCSTATVACQPIGASPALVSVGSSVGVLVITGGSDTARAFPNSSFYVGGFNAATGSQLFAPLAIGSLSTLPAGPVPSGGMPLRGYAALTVSGTALFADTTTLAVNDLQQLVQPALFPGQYGDVRRWNTINATPSAAATALPVGNAYSGGYGSILELNGASGGGSVVAVGTSQGMTTTLASNDSGLANAAYHVGAGAGVTGRNFTSKAWFDLSN